MSERRREFLLCAGIVLSGTVLGGHLSPQAPRHMPNPPQPAAPGPNGPNQPNNRLPQSAMVREHEKAFRDCLAALSGRVDQLKKEVESLHSSDVFSVTIYKQSSEIEKLAKQLKTLAKG
jgi:hypothetical protein